MRSKNALLMLLTTTWMALAIGCSAVGDVLTPDPTAGDGGGADNLTPPGQSESINGGAGNGSGAVDLQ